MILVVITEKEKAEARTMMTESLRDLLSMKITLPLGNPGFKWVHTNQFIRLDMPDEFYLENFEAIAKAMNSSDNRFEQYEKGRWYIEGVTINNDGKKFTIDLDLNPFPSSNRKFRENRLSYEEAYANSQGAGGKEVVASVNTSNVPGGQGAVIDNLVKNIVGTTTDELQKCKLIHEWLRKNVIYSWYECSRYKTPENCYNNRSHLNCADTAILTCSMMLSAGLNAYIVHRTYNGGHFWTIIEIGGKKYASDQTGRETAGMSGSAFNTVWSTRGRSNTSVTDYSHRESGFNTC